MNKHRSPEENREIINFLREAQQEEFEGIPKESLEKQKEYYEKKRREKKGRSGNKGKR